MVDPGTGLAVLGGAIGSKELIQKILGPTADYLGAGLAGWTERAIKNTSRVFEKAATKLGKRLDEPAAVPPKVLKGVLENAPFCDDELGAEYFGGVLASSRSGIERDDRGAAFLALVGRLSTYQIRSHFFFYSMVKLIFDGLNQNILSPDVRAQLLTFIPLSAYDTAMEFVPGEHLDSLLSHVLFGLVRENLIQTHFLYGNVGDIRAQHPRATTAGILFHPSILGTELYLWAHGRGDLGVRRFLDKTVHLASGVTINTAPGCCSVTFLERSYPPVEIGATPESEASKKPTE